MKGSESKMIKNYKIVEIPKIELGNLKLHNACSYYVDKDTKNYPVARFGRKTKSGNTFNMFMDKPENCPKGMKIMEQYDTPAERLAIYAIELKNEHSILTDQQMSEPSTFNGHKRSARWYDEQRRRQLN